jgi:transcriptional regulator with XRE-family HTH domain
MSLGDNLKRLRIDRGMTQGDLSNKSGVGLGQVSKIERNKADPTASTIYKLITALDCSADRLIHDKDKTGLTGLLKEQFERVSGLPQRDQEDLIRIMDKFCVANGLKTMLDEHRVLIGISGDSGVKAVI